jgi:hypothetical protein
MFKSGAVSGGFPVIANSLFNEDVSSPFTTTMPATVNVDDLLILFVHRCAGTGGPSASLSGWTLLDSATPYAIYYKWAAGTEDGSSVTIGSTGSPTLFCTVLRITGADRSKNPEISTVASGNNSTPDPPFINASWPDANNLFVAVVGSDDNLSVSAYPSGYTLYQSSNVATTGAAAVAAKTSLSSASENPGAFTLSGANNWYGFTLAVKGT